MAHRRPSQSRVPPPPGLSPPWFSFVLCVPVNLATLDFKKVKMIIGKKNMKKKEREKEEEEEGEKKNKLDLHDVSPGM